MLSTLAAAYPLFLKAYNLFLFFFLWTQKRAQRVGPEESRAEKAFRRSGARKRTQQELQEDRKRKQGKVQAAAQNKRVRL